MEIFYNNQLLFTYITEKQQLCCPYCHNTLCIFNNKKIHNLFMSNIKSSLSRVDLPDIYFRCFDCERNNPKYPFTFADQDNHFIPNDEQYDIIMLLYKHLLIRGKRDNLFLIEGEAGTGKTSIITHLLKYPEFKHYNICFSASTNKALNVLEEKFSRIYNSNEEIIQQHIVKFQTIFKLLNNKISINSNGDVLFDQVGQGQKLTNNYDVIIIDEVSMITKQQLETIMIPFDKNINDIHITHRPIIIFLGDRAQLPPVDEDTSHIFNQQFQQQYNISLLNLHTIMRSQNRVTVFAQKLRQLVVPVDEQHIPFMDMSLFIGNQIQYFSNKSSWITEYLKIYNTNLKQRTINKSVDAPMMIAFTNRECDNLNMICRNLIFNNPKDQYVNGELLVFEKNHYIQRKKIEYNIQQHTINCKETKYYLKFFTSELIIVDKIITDTLEIEQIDYENIFGNDQKYIDNATSYIKEKLSEYEFQQFESDLNTILSNWEIDTDHNKMFIRYKQHTISFNNITKLINQIDHKYVINELYINGHPKLDKNDTDPNVICIQVISSVNQQKYTDNCQKVLNIIHDEYQVLANICNSIHKNMKLIIDYIFQQIWTKYYYQQYIWAFANVTYGYSITSHKSQGSTYQNIFVNMDNIMGCLKASENMRIKSLYTSITRAAKSINLLYHKSVLTPNKNSNAKKFECQICHQIQPSANFTPINYKIDRQCADQILRKIKAVHLYNRNQIVILSDDNKNLYKIQSNELDDNHINDAYEYIHTHKIKKTVQQRYQYENLTLAQEIINQ